MKDHPINFSAPMVAALRAGTKTQSRRILNPQPDGHVYRHGWSQDEGATWRTNTSSGRIPIWAGDRLWVRESYYQLGHWDPVLCQQTKGGRQKWAFVPDAPAILFDPPKGCEVRLGRHSADPGTVCWHKRLGRFMPRAASRMTLIVTDVKVERLQDISVADALAEGIVPMASGRYHCGFDEQGEITCKSPVTAYAWLWNSINGENAWVENPWVVAYTFEIERPR